MTGIYVLKNRSNGRSYVGQSVNIKKRISSHKTASNKNLFIDNVIAKYGWDIFESHIFYDIPEKMLDLFETGMIKRLNTIRPNGYNIDSGGSKNKHLSESTKNKISKAMTGEKHPLYGKKHTEETKKKMAESRRGTLSPRKGKKHTEESKKKIKDSIQKRREEKEYLIEHSCSEKTKKEV